MKKYKIVKYKVNNRGFGNLNGGEIINAILISREGDIGLLYHPWTKGECPSFEFARVNYKNIWASSRGEFVNTDKAFEKDFLGKSFKFKREFY